jgi:nucleotidyltransferase substrate binding protein (TIGR01987 family)
MSMNKDIRWKQRFHNFSKALAQLQMFVDAGELNKMEEQGLIQAFEYTFELAWNTIKDYYTNQGVTEIQGSRDAFKLAANRDLIKDAEKWMKMVESRIKTVHTYDEELAKEIANDILEFYYPMFIQLQTRLQVEFLKG